MLTSAAGARLRIALAAGAVAFTGLQLIVGYRVGQFPFPGGEVILWSAVGDALLHGTGIYAGAPGTETFYYAPPWAVFFAAFSWLGAVVLQIVIWIVDIACLRYIAGSWRRFLYLGWMPLLAFELASGQTNLVVAAGIVAATRGQTGLAVPGALAKLSPILAVREPRQFLLGLLVAVAITLPWLGLWPEWIAKLAGSAGLQLGNTVPVALPLRLLVAGGFLALRRPWASALAAAIAIPALHWSSLVVLIAPIVVWVERRWPPTPAAT